MFKSVYDQFRNKIVEKANSLKLGIEEGCDLGPVINKRQQQKILTAIEDANASGGIILSGGTAPTEKSLSMGYYILPTVIEGLQPLDELSSKEFFGPVVTLHPVADIQEALEVTNSNEYGLTAAIHTSNLNRAMWFANRVEAGVVNANIGTFGSEPHMPFGGYGSSGNGTREPGTEALDVYSELKNISFLSQINSPR